MRAVVQRVSQAKVSVHGSPSGAIEAGLMALLGVHRLDQERDLRWMVEKIIHLRIFDDERGLMNRSLLDVGGQLLVVSQFTLLGDCRKGRRPSWKDAAAPEMANFFYQSFLSQCRQRGIRVESGVFQQMMQLELTNEGPVTLLLDSHNFFDPTSI